MRLSEYYSAAWKEGDPMKGNGIRKETMEDIHNFVHERNWEQFHTPKDLAISLSLEAAELLEIFQWSGADQQVRNKLPEMKEEIADVLTYCIQLCDVLDLDPDEILRAKMAKNRAKYPVDKAYGSAKKYTELK
jgi:NTP pyrophosphatase (non-canonical NTP hydrolase)